MNHTDNNLNENILAKIESGNLKMLPKWHFALHTGLYICGAILALLGILFVFSLIIFSLHLNGVWFIRGFGLRGFGAFLFAIPWFMALLGVVFVFILQILVRHFSYAYSKPLLYSGGIIIFAGILGSLLVAQTDFHKSLFMRTQRQRPPFNKFLYQNFGNKKQESVIVGKIGQITESGFLITNRENETFAVLITPETVLPPDFPLLIEDFVVVFGQRHEGFFEALGVKKIINEPFMNMAAPRMK